MNINFVRVLMFLYFFDLYAGVPRRKGKSGPYVTRLNSAHKCHKPKPPYLNVTNSTVEVELYNTSSKTNLVRANITVGYAHKNVMGPYVTRLNSAHKCHKPKPPYLNVTNSTVEVELYNTSSKTNLVRANITVGYAHKNVMGKAKQYKWVNGKWKLNLVMQSDQCNGPIGIWFKILALEYTTEQCAVPVGEYHIKDLDVNTIEHTLVPTTEYGKVLWRIEVFIRTGMLGCFEFETLVVPAP